MSNKISVVPAALDLELYAGDGFGVQFTFTDKATGEPFPVPGEWAGQVRDVRSDTAVVCEFLIDSSAANEGKIVASLTGDDVRAVAELGGCEWDIQQTPDGGQPRTWYSGKISAKPDVTRVTTP